MLQFIEVNCCHPDFYHVRCQATPSMKSGVYYVYILFDREPTIKLAVGYYDNDIILIFLLCTLPSFLGCQHHVHKNQLLHALVALRPSTYSAGSAPDGSDNEALAVTSYACQWHRCFNV